eukprot:COSAG02_NODE_33065_length_506_cov_0.597052_2_plen_21_part_01
MCQLLVRILVVCSRTESYIID